MRHRGVAILSRFQEDLLCELYELQRRYRLREWSFDATVRSRAMHALAKAEGKLRPSPVAGKANVERLFEQRFHRALGKLDQAGLLESRSVRTPEAPATFATGYKRHRARDSDVFLTPAGLDAAERLLRGRGLMASEAAACSDLPDPSGPVASGLAGCDE